MWSKLVTAIGVALGLSANPAIAGFDDPMEFYVAMTGGNCVSCYWIAAEGVIGPDTAEQFLSFLQDEELHETRGLNIHFNSPGGDLLGGILLGHAIRKQKANTTISAAHVKEIYDSGERLVSFDPVAEAECSSACVFAFSGGVVRFASKTTPQNLIGFQKIGRLGVHQFYDPDALANPSASAFDAEDRITDQKIISALLYFLSEMDVSAELLQLATRTDPREVHYLTEEQLHTTRIDNRMVKDVYIVGYPNGAAITEIHYQNSDAEYRLELFCANDDLHMLATINWRGDLDISARQKEKIYDGLSLRDGGPLMLVSEDYERGNDGGVIEKLRFRLSRMIEIRGSRKNEISGEDDRDWNTEVKLEIGPHPALSETQAKVIALDYGMRGGKAKIKVRRALLYYALRRLGLDTDPSAREPTDQQIALFNREALNEIHG